MRRSKYEIMSEMLYLALPGAYKTSFINSCIISHKMCEKYITTLLKKGLLEEKDGRFHTTKKGIQFLEAYQKLELLWEKNVTSKILQRQGIRKKRKLGLASSFA
jgi:predicted transcriptional regulator